MKSISTAAAALMSLSAASAAVTNHCIGSNNEVCFKWAVPQGSSDALFQIQTPSTYEWAALGIGRSMSSAKMFVVYQDGSGNVTLSTREASGHVEPEHVEMSNVSLMEGSGVKDGKMTANIRCNDCTGLDNTGLANWIAGWRSNGEFTSTQNDAGISIHTGKDSFRVDMSKAGVTTSSSENPFTSTTRDSTSGGGSGSSGGSDDAVSGSGGGVSESVIAAHGIVMAVAFAVLYPLGALLMPIVGKWWLHGGVQIVAFTLMWVGFGLGYYYAANTDQFWGDYHQQLGVVVVALLGLQPFGGLLHHFLYKRRGQRTIVSHIHIWFGRILMILGIINGGLGLYLQPASTSLKIAYAVVSGIFGGLYIGAAIWGVIKRRRGPPSPSTPIRSPKTAQQAYYSPDRSQESYHLRPSHDRPRY